MEERDARDAIMDAKLDRIGDQIEHQAENVNELKALMREFTVACSCKHRTLDGEVRDLQTELHHVKHTQRGIFWAIGALFSGFCLAFAEWIFMGRIGK